MKDCEKFEDKILYLDELPDEQQHEVFDHIRTCSDCRAKLKDLQAITAGLKNRAARHVDDKLLTRYGIHVLDPDHPDYDGSRLGPEEVTRVAEHVEICAQCQNRLAQITDQYRQIEEYLEAAGLPDLSLGRRSAWQKAERTGRDLLTAASAYARNLLTIPAPKFYPLAVATAAALFVLVWVSPLFRGTGNIYEDLISLQRSDVGGITRSEAPGPMTTALAAFQRGDYKTAIRQLETFVQTAPEDRLQPFAHYVLGAAYLFSARNDFMGRFVRYDSVRVGTGIAHLEESVRRSDNPRIIEDALWFEAIGFLMIEDVNSAENALREVVALKGRRLREAKEMLRKMEGNRQGPE